MGDDSPMNPPIPQESPRPPVIKTFRALLWFYGCFFGLVALAGFAMLCVPALRPSDAQEEDVWQTWLGVPIVALIAWLCFRGLRAKRSPRFWYFGQMYFIMGFLSCLWLIPCIWMMIQWYKPETKAYFGYTGPESLGNLAPFRNGLIGWLIERSRKPK
jgi:hypothetical protein